MAIPILRQVSAKLRFILPIATNEHPQPSQAKPEPVLIFLQLGHCLFMRRPPPVGGLSLVNSLIAA
jgi:hypothetical protein